MASPGGAQALGSQPLVASLIGEHGFEHVGSVAVARGL